MTTELVTQNSPTPFTRAMTAQPGVNAGAVAIESERAIAEVRTQIQMAKMFPRSVSASMTEFLDTCASPDFAAAAFYSVPNRGSGPSIRFAEELARCYGNFEFGHRELSRGNGKSEIEVYAWDKEKNNRSIRQITVEHVMDTRNGSRRLTDQADIDNKIANVASKQVRGRILALVPKHMAAAGIEACKRTLAGDAQKPISQRIISMCTAFGNFGVTNKMLESHLKHPVDNTTVDELADLMGIFNAIKEGAKPSEFFPAEQADEPAAAAPAAKAIADASASTKKSTPAVTAKPKPAAAAASKPAEKPSNPVIDEAPAPVEEPAQAGPDQTVNQAAASDEDAANAAAAAAASGEDDEVLF